MRSRFAAYIALSLSLLPCLWRAPAQTPPPATLDALHSMSRLAGIVFAGQVVAMRNPAAGNSILEIDFAVDDAVRGIHDGSYTLREWTGRWPAGDPSFRVGQQYLMLLHTPGPGGVSSPIGGMDGAIPIRGSATSPANFSANTSSPRSAPQNPSARADSRVVDLRWVAAGVIRAISYRAGPVAHPTSTVVSARVVVEGPVSLYDSFSPANPAPASLQQSVSYAALMATLRIWEHADAAR